MTKNVEYNETKIEKLKTVKNERGTLNVKIKAYRVESMNT